MKKMQSLTIWLLPIVVIGGLFIPVLGYLVVAMMAFFLTLSIFKGRYWCWNLCPRGAFLDTIMSKVSRNKPMPRAMINPITRWSVLVILMTFLVFRIVSTGGNLIAIGAVFVSMCLITTVVSIFIGFLAKHRGWCAICPMGLLQEEIHKKRKRKIK